MNIPLETLRTQWDMENIIKKDFYTTKFYKSHTRKTMRNILMALEPHVVVNNPYAFRGMTKKRMIRHIECYILLHQLKCEK